MRPGPLAGFVVTELSATFALPLGYGVASGRCAPPWIGCLTGAFMCAAVRTDPWAQFPVAATFGAALGAAPAALVALLVWGIERWRESRSRAPGSAGPGALGIVGVLGALLLVTLIFPYTGGYMMALVTAFGLAIACILGGGYAIPGRLASRGMGRSV